MTRALVLPLIAVLSQADTLNVVSGGAAQTALSEAVSRFERSSGHSVKVRYAPVGTLMRELAQGAAPDRVVLTADVMDDAAAKGWAQGDQRQPLGTVGVGVAVKQGAPLPDLSSVESFRQALLNAKSITYMDPNKGTSGKHFAAVLQRLGLTEAMAPKTRLGDAGFVVEPVAHGDIEIGIQQITEILPVQGAQLAGPLPAELQKLTVYIAAPSPAAAARPAMLAWRSYLASAEVRAIFKSKGFD